MSNEIRNWITQIKKGYLDLCVLRILSARGKSYGLELAGLLADHDLEVKEGTLYPLLHRMTKDGLLQSSWETQDIQGHPRKFYSLTKQGELCLESMLEHYNTMFKKLNDIGKQGATL